MDAQTGPTIVVPGSGAAAGKLRKEMFINTGPRERKRQGMAEEDAATEAPACAICLEDLEFGDRLSVMPCSHTFHVACLAQWLAISLLCPCCRRALLGQGCSP
ncbi:hypothetical protein HU200_054422 [Digitaria exilis]|uniref:RING-type domain-containing protein n=1 Tax=Digitaria exilis TaxID=1010633 RepID=A0A835E7L1_9POAL|nr:hypothetical protein HU200_054422 [Digitaria exilis]CAB3490915.1 unnamed protein product [Digitaria exilis]